MARAARQADRVHILGIRHHGPGSARAVRAALADLRPDAILIEGPPEADALVGLVEELEPPVALLAYVREESGGRRDAGSARSSTPGGSTTDDGAPGDNVAGEGATERAPGARRSEDGDGWAFWPFATFSPEWQALRYAVENGVPVRFCDLPAAVTLAARGATPETSTAPDDPGTPPGSPDPAAAEHARVDPLGVLAEAAGYDDPERWWDDVVEQRRDGEPSPFPAITEAMTAVRAELEPAPPPREARREAHMRQTLRAVLKAGHERVAVVCGAWHAPALRDLAAHPVKDDTALLRGLPKARTAITWVPWTHGRLATASGYGAGVTAPGWYHHLFTAPDRPIHRWLTEAARLLREEDQPVSSAHVIEAVRLAETLATVRGRPLAGLAEVAEATSAVLCEGAELRARLVHDRMVVGERLGAVPDSTPMVPLQRDLSAEQRRVRLKPEALGRDLELDLRKGVQRERSVLLHRLRLLGVDWGTPAGHRTRSRGTFRETWHVRWRPELDVTLIEASRWGTTVAAAATARARDAVAGADLPALTDLTERCLLAELTGALPKVLAAVADRAAVDRDVTHLMGALPPLARSSRYGDVRGTDAAALRAVADELLRRVCAGLAPAVVNLDDDAAVRMVTLVDEVHAAVTLLGGDAGRRWLDTLAGLATRDTVPGLVAGRVHRLLYDAGRMPAAILRTRLGLATSRGADPARAAAWLEGFLSGGGLILVHDHELLGLIDAWLVDLAPEAFTDVLPLLRRTFGSFHAPERRAIGEAVTRTGAGPAGGAGVVVEEVDVERAAPAVAAVAALVGAPAGPADSGPGGRNGDDDDE